MVIPKAPFLLNIAIKLSNKDALSFQINYSC